MKGLILTYLMTYGGSAAALFNPFVGVCVYWVLDIVRPQYMFAWAGTEGAFSQIVAIATAIGWAAKGFGNWRFGEGRTVYVLFVAAALWSFASALLAPHHDIALTFVLEQSKRLLMLTIALTTARSGRQLKTLLWVFVASAGYLAYELNMSYLAGSNQAQYAGYGGMDNNCLAISMVTCLGTAGFLVMQARAAWQKAIAATAALLIGHTVLLTYSRGGMLGLVMVAVAALVVMPKRRNHLLAMTLAAVIGLSLVGPQVQERFGTTFASASERDDSAQSRVDLWKDCLIVMERYPLFGVGPDHWRFIVAEFGWPEGKEAHSLWLQSGAEVGVPGALLLLMAYLVATRKAWRLARTRGNSPDDEFFRNVGCMVVASLAGYMLSVQFVTLKGLETPYYVLAFAIVCLRLVSREAGVIEEPQSAVGPSRSHHPAMVSLSPRLR